MDFLTDESGYDQAECPVFPSFLHNLLIQFALGLQTPASEAVNTDQGKVFRLGQMSHILKTMGFMYHQPDITVIVRQLKRIFHTLKYAVE